MTNPLPLETQVGQLLLDKGYTISTAESCTGGLIASRLTDIPGSSAYVLGAVVTYSNEAKQQLVKVREETLIQFGAVSEQTAREMALGVQKLFGTNIAVSVTGIAGPGGGTDEKPVGLTYIGLTVNDSVEVRKFIWGGTRIHNKTASADAAFEMILQAFS